MASRATERARALGFASYRQQLNARSRTRGFTSFSQQTRATREVKQTLAREGKPVPKRATPQLIERAKAERKPVSVGAWRPADRGRYRSFREMMAELQGVDEVEIERETEYRDKYRAAEMADWPKTPHGEFSDLLEYMGVREQDADWDVGDTGEVSRAA